MLSKISKIFRLSVVLTTLLLVGLTSLPLTVIAATNDSNSVLVSLFSSTTKPLLDPTFDSAKVKLGITPTGWSNSDDLTIDLNPPIPYQQILSEIALSGFKGTQNAPKFPKTLGDLQKELEIRGLTISEPWVGTEFTTGKAKETFEELDKQIAFMKAIGGNTIVVAELGGAVHQKEVIDENGVNIGVDPLKNRPRFSPQQWCDLLRGLNQMGKKAKENGMQLMYHPHIGTGVENFEDVDRLMADTNPEYVNLLLDTGHLYYAGVDPLKVAQKYANRIKHVHLKNIRQSVLDDSRKTGRSFLNSIRAGIFTVPGDSSGAIDFQPILQELAKVNYRGWLMVEAEQDPNKAEPLQYALMARKYLQKLIGF
jgi:inosose dehydratase